MLSLTSLSDPTEVVIKANHPSFAENWSPVSRFPHPRRTRTHLPIQARKLFVVSTCLFLNFNTCLSSALPAGAASTLAHAFSLDKDGQTSLPMALFLSGYIFGPIIFGPMSESFGRKPCLFSSFGLYTLSTLACALAPNWPILLVFRLLGGVGASAPQYILGGVYADLYPDLVPRGRAVMTSGLINNFGPLVGPIIAGYSAGGNWRWMFWIPLILATCNWPMLLLIPGPYAALIRVLTLDAHADFLN
jgi:MFS family permease